MDKESVCRWVEETRRVSGYLTEYLGSRPLEDDFGWGARLQAFYDSITVADARAFGVLLTGPDGCGKHTAAAHLARLLGGEGYEVVFLSGLVLGDREEGGADILRRVNALLDDGYNRQTALCLVLDEMESMPWRQELLSFLGQTLCEYWVRDDYYPLCLILIQSEDREIPSLLRSRLQLCRMALPDQAQRVRFLSSHGASLVGYVSMEDFAQYTKGFSYAQLADAVRAVGAMVDASDDGTVTKQDFVAFLDSQRPPAALPDLGQLAEKTASLLERLPKMLTDVVASHSVAAQSVQHLETLVPSATCQEDVLAGELSRVQNLGFREVANELWGEEEVRGMLSRCRQTITSVVTD